MNESALDFTEELILTDSYTKSNKIFRYFKKRDDKKQLYIEVIGTSLNYKQRLTVLIKDIFLPKGYPHSVSSDYLEYQIWDTCQAFCSSISGTLTVRAVMQGIGVGSEAATPVSAAVNWIIKDGTGMVGSILFAWIKGSKLDSDCKKWRLFADVLNDIAMFIELYTPNIINYSVYMLCLSTLFKALVGTAGSSTRAALITHQAIKGNIADVSAKDGSQELFTNLLAFVFGIFLLKNVTETDHIWTVMYTTTVFHLIFNYKAVRCLKMNVFNGERYRLALRTYLSTSIVPTIAQVNRKEAVFLGMGTTDIMLCGFRIVFGVNLHMAVRSQNFTASQFSAIVKFFHNKRYFILINIVNKTLNVSFRHNFEENDVLKAYFHSYFIGIAITHLQFEKPMPMFDRGRKNSPMQRLKNILHEFLFINKNTEAQRIAVMMKVYSICDNLVEKEFLTFCRVCREQGWNVKAHLININDWRVDWDTMK